ncbi:hypothetical protein BRADI_5g19506v3 [Brachypodium distachyon]|uniref:Uncharacterized protein n=1 Tax=Brachypodium distachyon TaxID=15368 RepID=A0A0Q3IDP1_BRADI|nr:hypothetical protein BRADI_5g19506v3 [Brachypodium distachyon]
MTPSPLRRLNSPSSRPLGRRLPKNHRPRMPSRRMATLPPPDEIHVWPAAAVLFPLLVPPPSARQPPPPPTKAAVVASGGHDPWAARGRRRRSRWRFHTSPRRHAPPRRPSSLPPRSALPTRITSLPLPHPRSAFLRQDSRMADPPTSTP